MRNKENSNHINSLSRFISHTVFCNSFPYMRFLIQFCKNSPPPPPKNVDSTKSTMSIEFSQLEDHVGGISTSSVGN